MVQLVKDLSGAMAAVLFGGAEQYRSLEAGIKGNNPVKYFF